MTVLSLSLLSLLLFLCVCVSRSFARSFFTFSLASSVAALDADQLSDAALLNACDNARETMPRVRIQLRNAFTRSNADNSARVRLDLGTCTPQQRAADWAAVVPERDVRVSPFDLTAETTAFVGALMNDTFVASSLFVSTPELCLLDCARVRVRQSDDPIAAPVVQAELNTISAVQSPWMVNFTTPVFVASRLTPGMHRWPIDVSWRVQSSPPGFTAVTGPLLPHFVNTTAQTGIMAVREINVEACAGVWLRTWWEATGSASLTLYYNGELVLCAASADTECDDDPNGSQVDIVAGSIANRTLATGLVFVGPRANNASGTQLLAARVYSAWAFDVVVTVDRSSCPAPPPAPPVVQFLLAQQQWRSLKAPFRAAMNVFSGTVPASLRAPAALDGSLPALINVTGFGNFSNAATAVDMVMVLATIDAASARMRRPTVSGCVDCARLLPAAGARQWRERHLRRL
jgi:hypothetical protein